MDWTVAESWFDSRRGQDIFLFSNGLKPSPEPIQPHIHCVVVAISYGPGRKADLSPPPSVKVKNEWSYTSFHTYAFMM